MRGRGSRSSGRGKPIGSLPWTKDGLSPHSRTGGCFLARETTRRAGKTRPASAEELSVVLPDAAAPGGGRQREDLLQSPVRRLGVEVLVQRRRLTLVVEEARHPGVLVGEAPQREE